MRTSEGPTSLAQQGRPRPRRRRGPGRWITAAVLLVFLVGVAVAGYYGWTTVQRGPFSSSCTATASGSSVSFTPEQTANAALIAAISRRRGLPARAATIAIATSIQEAKLRNLTFGDRDSVGLFQQRPSMGWGTREQVLDPTFATNKFYDALVKIDGYENQEITKVAQAVQKSAYPEAYADHEQEGRILASTLRGHSPAGLVCQLGPITAVTDAAAVSADLAAQLGVTATQDGSVLTVAAASGDLAWAAGQWSVARAEAYGIDRVQVGDRVWTRGEGSSTWTSGAPASSPTTVTVKLGAVQG